MSHDYGPLRTYEITWTSGHVERIHGHQVTWPPSAPPLFGTTRTHTARRVMVHGHVDGEWRLLLAAHPDDIRTVRDITHGEHIAPSA